MTAVVEMIIERLQSESPARRVYGKKIDSIKKMLVEAGNESDNEIDLKGAAFDTDNVLTSIEAHDNRRSTLRQASSQSPGPLLCYSPRAEWLFRYKTNLRLNKIQRGLEKSLASHGSMKQPDGAHDSDGSVKQPRGGSAHRGLISESIKRRLSEDEKFLTDSTNEAFEEVIDWLLLESKDSDLDVVGIVGEVGVGKTLLARKIFEYRLIKNHFPFRFWVDIPKNCDQQGAVKAMLRGLTHYRTGNIILEYGQQPEDNLKSMMKVIKGRYLLVLDNTDHFDNGCKWWDHLKSYLPLLAGGKVLVLSNNRNADIERKITLNPLGNEESLNLFRAAAKEGVNLDMMEPFQDPAEKVLKKCCGLPIAINAMGAMLADKSLEKWNEVLEKLENKEGEEAVAACLRLCCEDLKEDKEGKKCFQSLSIFGEQDMEIDKMSLIYWWIGEGLVPSEDKGKKAFEKLVGRSLVEGIKTGKGKIYSCRVHHIVRKLLLEDLNIHELSKSPHRLSFSTELKAKELDEGGQKPLESILQVGNDDPNYLDLPVGRFPELKHLKVLHLGWWQKSSWFHVEISTKNFLPSLCYLENLRHLSLRGISGITQLPRSIKKLRRLQILDLRACYDLEKLPEEITLLKELTHLDTSRCYFLEFMPEGLGKLSKLESLRGFKLGNSRNRHCCRLLELQNLKQLSKLSIRIWRESEVQEDELRLFKNFHNLTALRLEFGYRERTDEDSNSKLVTKLNQLCPPPHLAKLELLCYPGKETPAWLNPSSLPYLQRLYFSGGPLKTIGDHFFARPRSNEVSNAGKKWNLETLCLRFLANLQGNEEDLRQAIPCDLNLDLKVHKCPGFTTEMDRRCRGGGGEVANFVNT